MLKTGLPHIENDDEIRKVLSDHARVMICCGRMGPMCIPVYQAMEQLRPKYPQVAFFDMDFDIPAADFIKALPECAGFMGLPFTVYFEKGRVVAATTSIQTREQIEKILKEKFNLSE